jgi:two-component system cell cycle sensor histidine kinase PleC
VPADLPDIVADKRALKQILLNLLSNAIKFTPQGADIVIKVGWTASGGQYFSVRDNGAGIPEDEIETVLSTFGRGSQALKNAEPGSGLGLPIVKSLVELHGGAFRLTSKLREGTEVTAIFPANRVMTAMAAVDQGQPKPALGTSRAA